MLFLGSNLYKFEVGLRICKNCWVADIFKDNLRSSLKLPKIYNSLFILLGLLSRIVCYGQMHHCQCNHEHVVEDEEEFSMPPLFDLRKV